MSAYFIGGSAKCVHYACRGEGGKKRPNNCVHTKSMQAKSTITKMTTLTQRNVTQNVKKIYANHKSEGNKKYPPSKKDPPTLTLLSTLIVKNFVSQTNNCKTK